MATPKIQIYSPDGALVVDTSKFSFRFLGSFTVTEGEGTKVISGLPAGARLAVATVPVGKTDNYSMPASAGVVLNTKDTIGWTFITKAGFPAMGNVPTKIIYGYF